MRNIAFKIAVLILFTLSACTTPNIIVSNNLNTDTSVMDAKGRQGWQFNQVISFGDFQTSKIKKGWTSAFQLDFIARFKGAKQKLRFTQQTPWNSAEVLAIGEFDATELDLLDGFLTYTLKYENYFAGTIIPDDRKNNEWEFIIHNPEGGSLGGNYDCGIVQDKSGNEILIRGVREIENQKNWLKLENFGFEFIRNGQAIGAVSTINNGKVWIKNNISEDLKLVIASLASSLLVREELQKTSIN